MLDSRKWFHLSVLRSRLFSRVLTLIGFITLFYLVFVQNRLTDYISSSWSRPSLFGEPMMPKIVIPTDVPTMCTIARPSDGRKALFDVVIFHKEFDALEIRLRELSPVVNVFFIIESPVTFSGQSKPLYFQENKDRFAAFNHKIVHIVIPPMTAAEQRRQMKSWNITKREWAEEYHTRDIGLYMAIQMCRPQDGDWIFLSDIDELPRPGMLNALMKASSPDDVESKWKPWTHRFSETSKYYGGDIFRFECMYYYGSYEFRGRGKTTVGPVAVRFREPDSPFLLGDRKTLPMIEHQEKAMQKDWRYAGSVLRRCSGYGTVYLVPDACWHCSWCFNTIADVHEKLGAYSHQENNQEQYKDPDWIIKRLQNGKDLFNETNTIFLRNPHMNDIPQSVRDNLGKFEYLTMRSKLPNGGFTDTDSLKSKEEIDRPEN
ncbi:beta-1,4-mannosyl-glycoprotein beta-1,4-N-acetylglucosaminyltransferase [Entomortierella parvispora]|uniref:Beta-1,4-mannosyl-glycoprotein beta-1,4-N-acetylglucosaminyltransferase n=1 Tax=Entomortierella parvispora TaxID=205924 RepID=A0A9P3M1B0_9FUNG|nr:beta-1,4-mannosyl-glycoprotein beta-1,4-N-acetylglucosaminyltransferase [Entomortierella parvispora]